TCALPIFKTYKAEIAPLDNEKNTANNSRKFAVEIIDQKTKVLLLSAFPHPDLGAFKKAIEHNKQRQADIKYIDDAVDFGDYQLVVLYQHEANFKEAYEKIDQLMLNTIKVTGMDTDYLFLNKEQAFFTNEINPQNEDFLPVYN